MDKKVKADMKNADLMKVIEAKNVKIRELDQLVRKLKAENEDLLIAVEEFEASGARRRPKPKPQAAPGAPKTKGRPGEPEPTA